MLLFLGGNYGKLNTLWMFIVESGLQVLIMTKKTDVVIIGTGAAGLFCALHFPEQTQILMLTKEEVDKSDSFLAQGGICMLRGEEDYEGYFEDTMRAGHYENNPASVEVMIRSSQGMGRSLPLPRKGGMGDPVFYFMRM